MKISVITPTWQRHDLLIERCLPSVQAQTVDVEHVVVCDGPDPLLRDRIAATSVLYTELHQHPDPPNCGTFAINRGCEISTGDYLTVLDDDNAFRPDHCELLAAALDANPEADFVFSQILRHGIGDIIGTDPPFHGGIDGNALMWRRATHEKFGAWPAPCGRSPDWLLVSNWILSGARWNFVPRVTVDYYYWPGAISWRG